MPGSVGLTDTARRGGPIAILLWSGNVGGAETWSVGLAREFQRIGVQVALIFVCGGGPLCTDEGLSDLPSMNLSLAQGSDLVFRPWLLRRALRQLAPDTLIAPSGGYLCAQLRLVGFRGRILIVEHGDLLHVAGWPWHRRVAAFLDRLIGSWAADAQIAPSLIMRDRVLDFPHSRVVVHIPHGVDFSKYSQPVNGPQRVVSSVTPAILGFAGRLALGKGGDLLLRALARLEPHLDWRLQVAGDGPERRALEDLSRELGIDSRVRFLGWVQDMPSFWSRCDVAVVPSDGLTESFGMVVIEAMASGVPVVASARGGPMEIVRDNETGLLFTPGDRIALAACLSRYVGDPPLRRRHGAAARECCLSEYDMTRCASAFSSLIEHLRDEASGGGRARALPRG